MRLQIDVNHHFDADSASAAKLDQILALLAAMSAERVANMAKLDDYSAQIQTKINEMSAHVRDQTTIETSVQTLLEGQTQMIADLRAQVQTIVDSSDAAATAALQPILDALTAQETALRDTNQQLRDDVTANTPQQPPTP